MVMADRNAYLAEMDVVCWRSRGSSVAAEHAAGSAVGSSPDQAGTAAGVSWEKLQREVASCTRCALHDSRRNTVFGSGSTDADWFFVGEAPGREADRQGIPFVGRAGQLLSAMLFSLGLSHEEVYIANVLKCRPPDNRDPQGVEVNNCESFLHQQVAHIGPRIIVALGRFAAQALLQQDVAISQLRGKVHQYNIGQLPLVVTYHPAYLLRSPTAKAKSWQDLMLARSAIE